MTRLDCSTKLPVNKSAPHLGLSLDVASFAIEADATRFFGFVWFAFYAEKLLEFSQVKEYNLPERFVLRNADFNADSALLDKG